MSFFKSENKILGDFAFDLACSDLNKLIKMTGEQNVSNLSNRL